MKKEPPTSAIIGAAVAVGSLGYGVYNSIDQKNKANDIKPKTDPVYNIPQEFYQNREIARQMAQVGIPQQQYNNASNNINQNQAAGIAALNNSANPGAGVTSLVRQGNIAKGNLDASDAAARENNQRFLVQENGQLGQQELAKQQSDVFDKYTRDFNQSQAYAGAGQQTLNNTINAAGSLGQSIAANSTPSSPTAPVVPATGDIPAGTAQQMQLPGYMWNIPAKQPYQYPGQFSPWDGTDQSLYKPLI